MDRTKRILRCAADEGFSAWMAEAGGSLAISTYQAGRLVMVGWNGRQVSVLPRELPRPMGLVQRGPELAVACQNEVIFFANAPLLAPHYPEENCGRYDALFLPRASYLTGSLSVHDIAFGADGLWLVNTRFSCLGLVSRQFSFEPKWQPPFISALVPEDRCHLNGLAMLDGRPTYVTAHGETDTEGGWREGKATGGVLIDVETGETALRGLAMPHSPRRDGGTWWLLNSGAGELWRVDPDTGEHDVAAALPGYLRGLCFTDHFALVGLSQVRRTHLFEGMPVQDRFKNLYCGVVVVDLQTGKQVGLFEFTSGCEELYDVAFLPEVRCPSILGASHPAAHEGVTAPGNAYWLRTQEHNPDTADGESGTAVAKPNAESTHDEPLRAERPGHQSRLALHGKAPVPGGEEP